MHDIIRSCWLTDLARCCSSLKSKQCWLRWPGSMNNSSTTLQSVMNESFGWWVFLVDQKNGWQQLEYTKQTMKHRLEILYQYDKDTPKKSRSVGFIWELFKSTVEYCWHSQCQKCYIKYCLHVSDLAGPGRILISYYCDSDSLICL